VNGVSARDESVLELKFGQVGIANLRLWHADPVRLEAELGDKVQSAPALFRFAPVVLDLSHLPALPTSAEAVDLLQGIRRAGMLPVGLAYGTSETEALARELDLPLLAKFRANDEPLAAAPAAREPAPESAPEPARREAPVEPPGTNAVTQPDAPQADAVGLIHDQPVRSGQQLYARRRDLILLNIVGNGAEVIADGSIHVYGALRGRALAGAQGDTHARILCQSFHAQLLSIAGQYRVFEEIPRELRGKPVQAWLEDDKLRVEVLRV
jgi:septum site-determining protein MinC